jgi:hypothetical protein
MRRVANYIAGALVFMAVPAALLGLCDLVLPRRFDFPMWSLIGALGGLCLFGWSVYLRKVKYRNG